MFAWKIAKYIILPLTFTLNGKVTVPESFEIDSSKFPESDLWASFIMAYFR